MEYPIEITVQTQAESEIENINVSQEKLSHVKDEKLFDLKYEKLSEIKLNGEDLSEMKKINKNDLYNFNIAYNSEYINITAQTKDNIVYYGSIAFKESMKDLLNNIIENKYKDYHMEIDEHKFCIKIAHTEHITIVLSKTNKIKPKELFQEIIFLEKDTLLYLTINSNLHTYKTTIEYSEVIKNLLVEIQKKTFFDFSVKFGFDGALLNINYMSDYNKINKRIILQMYPYKLKIISLERNNFRINMIILFDRCKRSIKIANNEQIWYVLRNIQNGIHDDYRWEVRGNNYSLVIGYIDIVTRQRQTCYLDSYEYNSCIIL